MIKRDQALGRVSRFIPQTSPIILDVERLEKLQTELIPYRSVMQVEEYNRIMHRAIFLDRDGVLIENRPDYVRAWSQVRMFSRALEALSMSKPKIYKFVIVTNQSGIERDLIPLESVQEINQKLVEAIREKGGQIDGVYVCPHRPDQQCSCRKPRPGLILQAAKELSLDLQHSWMIGDAWSDLLAGKAAGIQKLILVKTGRGAEQLAQRAPENIDDYWIFNDLSDALEGIFRHP